MYVGPLNDRINFPGMFQEDNKVKAFHADSVAPFQAAKHALHVAAANRYQTSRGTFSGGLVPALQNLYCTKKFTIQPSCLAAFI